GEVSVRASARVADALQELSGDMDIYQGVKLAQVLEAAYIQGKKDGAKEVFDQYDQAIEAFDSSIEEVKRQIPHRPPGRPRGRRAE
ncbi:MAG: hypothetical protein M3P39_09750, partial [Actinomycetota bacterium]|nr:hypothetical protein [Actinomycetota bacterium]